jgi:dihydroxy-acid dehydratase
MARAVGVDLTLDDFQRISDKTPFLADLKPSGKYVMEDIQKYGGIPAVMRYLLDKKMIHGDCMTVTGKTIAENLKDVKPIPVDNPIVKPLENPIKKTGHLQILYGNIAPEGSVAKITGKEGLKFEGVAKVYDSEELMMAGLARKEIKPG